MVFNFTLQQRGHHMLAGLTRAAAIAVIAVSGLLSQVGLASAGELPQIVKDYVAAWNAHDAAKAASYFADNIEYYDASVGEPQMGRDAARTNVIEAFLNAVPDATWVVNGEAVVEGDAVSFAWTFAGTNTGDWSDGTAATGKAFTLHGLSLFRMTGGEISYQGDYYDALGFYAQLGLM